MSTFKDSKSDVLSADLDGGVLNPQAYTTAERDALTTMVAGDVIYNSTTNKLNFYSGSAWEAVTSA